MIMHSLHNAYFLLFFAFRTLWGRIYISAIFSVLHAILCVNQVIIPVILISIIPKNHFGQIIKFFEYKNVGDYI